ncbi:MAG TPA: hypothetical protein VLA56_04780, partial [Pseudomonadales bacterium]|nr:hypothetical protein [Pseudomonadales bacterium]
FASADFTGARFEHVALVYRAGVMELWANDRLVGSAAVAAFTFGAGTATFQVFDDRAGGRYCHVSLLTVSDYAPTRAQLLENMRIRRAWHQPGADPTLLSDTVDALGYDEDAGLLFVGGPAGTTVLHADTLTRQTTLTSADSFLTSDNHDAVAGGGGISLIASSAEVRIALPALPLRDRLLRPSALPVRGRSVQTAATTDATPTVIASGSIAEGEVRTFICNVSGQEAGDPAATTEHALYQVEFSVRRPIAGNVEILGAPNVTVVDETAGPLNLTLAANTTDQLWELTASGLASTDMVWSTDTQVIGEHRGRAGA